VIVLTIAAFLALAGFAFMSTWGCQPGNIHLAGMC